MTKNKKKRYKVKTELDEDAVSNLKGSWLLMVLSIGLIIVVHTIMTATQELINVIVILIGAGIIVSLLIIAFCREQYLIEE